MNLRHSYVAIIISLGLFCAYIIYEFNQLPVVKINVFGEIENVDPVELEAALAPWVNQHWLFFNLEKLTDDLMQVAWIKAVKIETPLIGHISILLTQKQPIMRWQGQRLITHDGKFFTVGARTWLKYEHLPTLISDKNHLSLVANISPALKMIPSELGTIKNVTIKPWNEIEVQLTDFRIISSADLFTPRIERFIRWYQKLPKDLVSDVKTYDLRYKDGFAIKTP